MKSILLSITIIGLSSCAQKIPRANPVEPVNRGLEAQAGRLNAIDQGNLSVQSHIDRARNLLKP